LIFFDDILDKGAERSTNKQLSLKGYLSIIAAGCSLVVSLNNNILDFLKQYSTLFPDVNKFLPLVLLAVLTILLNNVYKAKVDSEGNGKMYKYSNLPRQLSKIFTIPLLVVLIYSSISIYNKLKPMEQPVIVFIKGVDNMPLPYLSIRVLNEQKLDITQGSIETTSVDGRATITSKKYINSYSYLFTVKDNKEIYIPFSQLQKVDSTVFNKTAYYIILK